ncbi:histone deacetylase family protein [Algicella marina]|uniref:Histone deacetylase family protein n=1 Tax=Algicella marina TaxID=2683284 RepID=A0A6P1T5H9_9RHOB|nr:histone deacetylase family protein [Algicella marina]QHQ36960.1 histone deacetylase family protein [Algicella marina]
MSTALLHHADCLGHVTPYGHPEQVARLEYVSRALSTDEFAPLVRVEAPLGEDAHLLLAHPQAYVTAIRNAAPADETISLDPDTHMSPGSLNAALRAVGANVKAVDMVLDGEVGNAFCATRPPGHHAEKQTPMGFCLFGNAVIAARHALRAHGLSRAAIIDFDVHHGNGTQDLVWDDADILFASSHQSPLYPGSGKPEEQGAHGQIVNVPLPPNSDGTLFRKSYERIVFPAVEAHKPEIIIISAGFDAHRDDPLANLNLIEEDFAWATREICRLADGLCGGRVVSTLEGGYDLDALASSAAAHVRTLMEAAK